MFKNKGKILLTAILVLLMGVLFASISFALEGDSITITFYNSGNNVDKNYGNDGTVSLTAGQPYTLPDKDVEEGKSFNWRSQNGQAWEGGTEVTFYEDTSLFPVTAMDVYTAEELYTLLPSNANGIYRLMDDIYLERKPDYSFAPWGVITILMNGKTLEMNSNLSIAWGGQRAGTKFYGTGRIEYSGSNTFANLQSHGTGGDCCRLYIGRGVTLNAPNATLGQDGDRSYVQGYPYITVDGIVNCKTVLKLTHAGNRNPRIEVNKTGRLSYSEVIVNNTNPGNTVHVIVNGGTVICNNSALSFFNDSSTIYEITGGAFKFAYSGDNDTLFSKINPAKYRIIELTDKNGTTYQTVIDMECTHKYEYKATVASSCQNGTYDVFRCSVCSDDIYLTYGNMIDHDVPSDYVEYVKESKEARGWKKYICSCCSCAIYEYVYYDPTNDFVTVIVDTGSGKTEVQAVVKDVFDVDSTSTIKAIKAFADKEGNNYTLEQIVGLYIPVGISAINISTENAYVTELVLGQYLNANIVSLTKLTKLEKITIEEVIYLKFYSNCAPTSLKSVVSKEVENGNRSEIEFAENAFSSRSNLTEFTFVSNADYIFGKRCFYRAGIKSVIWPDNCKVTFKGEQAFYESSVEYLYVGKGITEIANKPFDCAKKLQKIILMDVVKLSTDYSFCCMNEGASVPVIYHHADKLELHGNTFYQSHGVIIYTKAPITQGFNSCKSVTKNGVSYPAYTIHYGISHPYERVDTPSTCTKEGSVKYITTCPCGINEGTSYKIFKGVVTNSETYTVEDYADTIKEILPHDLGVIKEIGYLDGYTKYGYAIYNCSMCGNNIEEDKPSRAPMIKCLGYSVPDENGTKSITVKYVIDKEMLEAYETANGVSLEYGVVVVARSVLSSDQTPLDASGNAVNGAIKYQISDLGYTSSQIKLSNLGEKEQSESFVMCTYIKDGTEISYIQDNETVDNPSGVSYKEIKELADYLASLSKTTVSEDE